MKAILSRSVLSELAARRFAWAAGVILAAVVTTLVVLAIPYLGTATGLGLTAAVAATWAVLGAQAPRLVRA